MSHKHRRAAGGNVGITVSFEDSGSDATSGSTMTVSSMGIGAASATRKVVACITFEAGVNRSITGVTIAGQTASRAIRATASDDRQNAEIWIADVSTGTTGDVAVTFNGIAQRIAVSTYSTTNLSSSTPTATATDVSHTSTIMDVSVNVPSGDAVLIACSHNGTTGDSATWTGVTEGSDFDYDTSSNHTSGSELTTSAETPRTVQCDYGSNPVNEQTVSAVFQ